MFLVSTVEVVRDRRRALAVSLTHVCVSHLECEVSISVDRCVELPERSFGCFPTDTSSLHRIS